MTAHTLTVCTTNYKSEVYIFFLLSFIIGLKSRRFQSFEKFIETTENSLTYLETSRALASQQALSIERPADDKNKLYLHT